MGVGVGGEVNVNGFVKMFWYVVKWDLVMAQLRIPLTLKDKQAQTCGVIVIDFLLYHQWLFGDF